MLDDAAIRSAANSIDNHKSTINNESEIKDRSINDCVAAAASKPQPKPPADLTSTRLDISRAGRDCHLYSRTSVLRRDANAHLTGEKIGDITSDIEPDLRF